MAMLTILAKRLQTPLIILLRLCRRQALATPFDKRPILILARLPRWAPTADLLGELLHVTTPLVIDLHVGQLAPVG